MSDKIVISQFNWLKILEYAKQCPTEISGFGSIILNADGDVEVNELFPLLPQICSGVETDPDLTNLITSPFSKRAGLWWHSHVNMSPFWSPTDEKCIESLGEKRIKPLSEKCIEPLSETKVKYLLSIVVNKKGEYRCRFDYFKPYRMFVDEINLDVIYNFPQKHIDIVAKEIKTQVKRPILQSYNYNGNDFLEERLNFKQIPQFGIEKKQSDLFVDDKQREAYERYYKDDYGKIDPLISATEESDFIKAGYMFDEVSQQWVFPE